MKEAQADPRIQVELRSGRESRVMQNPLAITRGKFETATRSSSINLVAHIRLSSVCNPRVQAERIFSMSEFN